jgi:hypothetical protein
MKTKLIKLVFVAGILACLFTSQVYAQSEGEGLRLRISKIFGYNSFGNTELQGQMKLSVEGPENLQQVTFYMDGEVMAEDNQPPFEVTFNTDSYSLGEHAFTAAGTTTDGRELSSNEVRTRFVTPQQGMEVALKIVIPLVVVVLLVGLISSAGPLLFSRGKLESLPYGAERKYGIAGGAICPRCKRPFPLRVMAINMGPGMKLDRCPYCGKWGFMRRRSLNTLRAAEAAELELARQDGSLPVESEEERLRKELDKSRYQDLS